MRWGSEDVAVGFGNQVRYASGKTVYRSTYNRGRTIYSLNEKYTLMGIPNG